MFHLSNLGCTLCLIFFIVTNFVVRPAFAQDFNLIPGKPRQPIVAKQRLDDVRLIRGKKMIQADALLVNAFMDLGFVIEPGFDQSLGKRVVKRLFICQAYGMPHQGLRSNRIPVTAQVDYYLTETSEGTEVRLRFDYNSCQNNSGDLTLQHEVKKKQTPEVYKQVWAALGRSMFLEEINLSANAAH